MISVSDVHKIYHTRFGSNHVLDGVSFDLRMGEKLGILGRNGAGKSTLVRLVSGAEPPTAGTIERRMSVSWPLAFGGAFQISLTGKDNVRFISRIYDQDFDRNLAFVEDFAELGPYLNEPVRTYSSGMRARLAFAISMIIEFDCFLIDEIAAVGDARFHERCNYELFDMRSDRAMMIISHDPGYLRDHCNRFAVLHQSRMVHFGDFDEAQDFFLTRIGAAKQPPPKPLPFSRRMAAIESLYRVAHDDERFVTLVRKADRSRDRNDWATAEQLYAEALTLHPYERSYWAQLGNVAREQGKRQLAEIAYRTACAYGESPRLLMPFIEAVNPAVLTDASIPVLSPDSGDSRYQPAGYPDIALLAGLLRGQARIDESEALEMMRNPARLEYVAKLMAQSSPHSSDHNDGDGTIPSGISVVPGTLLVRNNWIEDLCRVTGTEHAALARHLELNERVKCNYLLALMIKSGGFNGWNISLSEHN